MIGKITQKCKKILLLFCVMLYLAITISCKTSNQTIALPPSPQRQEISEPLTESDFIFLLVYYESLVEKWEAWRDAVYDVLGVQE